MDVKPQAFIRIQEQVAAGRDKPQVMPQRHPRKARLILKESEPLRCIWKKIHMIKNCDHSLSPHVIMFHRFLHMLKDALINGYLKLTHFSHVIWWRDLIRLCVRTKEHSHRFCYTLLYQVGRWYFPLHGSWPSFKDSEWLLFFFFNLNPGFISIHLANIL